MLWKCWGWLNMKFQTEWKWGLRLSKMPFQAEWKCSLRLSENEIWGQPTWGNWCLVACSYPVGRQAGVMKGRDDGCQDNGCIHNDLHVDHLTHLDVAKDPFCASMEITSLFVVFPIPSSLKTFICSAHTTVALYHNNMTNTTFQNSSSSYHDDDWNCHACLQPL